MESFKKDGVIPDVIDGEPKQLLKINYGGTEISPGQVMTPTLVKDLPKIEFEAESGAYYTLVMTDPDAPSRKDPKFGEWHHWLVVNIPGNAVENGETKSEYVGAGPPNGTGLHRYVFLVYKQSDGKKDWSTLKKLTNRSMDGRAKKKVREFLCSPFNLAELVAANFFQAEHDDYVPKLYEQLSGK